MSSAMRCNSDRFAACPLQVFEKQQHRPVIALQHGDDETLQAFFKSLRVQFWGVRHWVIHE